MNTHESNVLNALIATSILILGVAGSSVNADQEDQSSPKRWFSFALIGDVPYKVAPGENYPPYDNLVKNINDDSDIDWIMHAGDIKSGSTACSDALFSDRLERFNQFFKPFIYTPGDNEWTDCHRVKAGEYQPLERLAKLREVFFPQPGVTLGANPFWVYSQAFSQDNQEFPENVLWTHKEVVFASVHMVGSNNGLKAFDADSRVLRTQADDDEAQRRIQAAIKWIDSVFTIAAQRHAKGIFIMMQANPEIERGLPEAGSKELKDKRLGFNEVLKNLEEHTKSFASPVVLAHGDSHYFRVDQPGLSDPEEYIANFTRVETYGSNRVHWVKVTVDPESNEVFHFKRQIIKENVGYR